MADEILAAMPLPHLLLSRLAERYVLHGPLARSAPDAVPETARGTQVLLTLGSLATGPALMDALPRLGLIACYGTGFEGVDRTAAAARGIQVTHAPNANATSVAEFAMGLVLAAARDIRRGDALVRRGGWTSLRIDRMPLVPGLAGRRLGIYGLGTIGQKIAQRAAAFEMKVGYHNRSPRPDLAYVYHATLAGLAAWSDILVVAARADQTNRHAVDATILAALGPEGVLVNIARGSLVDEPALCDALEAGGIAAAGLDVYVDEPTVPERMRRLENVVVTPHMAALSRSAQQAQQEILAGNLAAFFAGQPLQALVPG